MSSWLERLTFQTPSPITRHAAIATTAATVVRALGRDQVRRGCNGDDVLPLGPRRLEDALPQLRRRVDRRRREGELDHGVPESAARLFWQISQPARCSS